MFSISSVYRSAKSISLADNQAFDVRIPGVTAILHTSTAVMFTSRLSGVKTCNLHTRIVHSWGGSDEPGVFLPR